MSGLSGILLFIAVPMRVRVLNLSGVFISVAAAALVASVTIAITVAVMVMMPSLLYVCITVQQLLRCRHRWSFHNNLFIAHFRDFPCHIGLKCCLQSSRSCSPAVIIPNASVISVTRSATRVESEAYRYIYI
jgi:hypothetical protein